VQQAVKHMQRGGRIVCGSSVSATIPFARHALYAASKAAVEVMIKNISLELGPRDITINAIAPGNEQILSMQFLLLSPKPLFCSVAPQNPALDKDSMAAYNIER
jgi:NAD(P)-dependent dehydrogenase (short-subunit alcohol dehydrogenase family)